MSWSSFFLLVLFSFAVLPIRPVSAYLMDTQGTSFSGLLETSSQSAKSSIAEEFYKNGIAYLSKNELDKALKAFEESLKKDPKFVNSILGLSEVYFKKQQIGKAGTIIKDALNRIKNDDSLYLAWGRYLYLEKKFNEAEFAIKKAIELNPQSEKARLDLGDLYLNAMHKNSEAMKAYKEVIEINPNHAGAHYAFAMVMSSLGQEPDKVRAELNLANQLEPNNPLPVYALAQTYAKQNNHSKVLELLEQVTKISPTFTRAIIQMGDEYLTLNNTEKSLERYTKASQLDPKFIPIYTKIGMVHQVRQEWDEAEKYYRKAIDMDPNQPFTQNNLAWLLFERKGNLSQALVAAQKAVDLAPGVSQFQDTLTKIKEAKNQAH